jgi:hypothetical protein
LLKRGRRADLLIATAALLGHAAGTDRLIAALTEIADQQEI